MQQANYSFPKFGIDGGNINLIWHSRYFELATATSGFAAITVIFRRFVSKHGYAFDFTLINGWLTVMNMLLMCALAMMVFMGFGFLVSSLAKNETTIPPFSNLITLPQFLLAGTFFSIDNFPEWLQPICRVLPLTFLNDALRKIAFDGANLWAVKDDIFFLLIWGVVVYGVTVRVFKWE